MQTFRNTVLCALAIATLAACSGGKGGSNTNPLFGHGLPFLFSADDGKSGFELWRSNGTYDGTSLVRDINVGGNASPTGFTELNSVSYFRANDGSGIGNELWKSDGTFNGTEKVKSVNITSDFTVFKGALYFTASDVGTGDVELWKSDGTTAGTVRVKDINTTGSSYPANLTVVNDTILFFSADNGKTGRELWKSDGSEGGTVQVDNINTTAITVATDESSFSGSYLGKFAVLNGEVYFPASDGTTGEELWKSDGTLNNASRVADINKAGGVGSSPHELIVFKNLVFFVANDGGGDELWKTDGGTNTNKVHDINSTGGSNPMYLTVANGLLFFAANDGNIGVELWATDGSDLGTDYVQDINQKPTIASSSNPSELFSFNDTLYFVADDGTNGTELWTTDGTHTAIFKDINTTPVFPSNSDPYGFTIHDDMLFFAANDGEHGTELWVSDGTADGTQMVRDINTAPMTGSAPFE